MIWRFGIRIIKHGALVMVFAVSLAHAADSSSINYSVPWYVLDGGGGTAISTNYTVNGSAGQPAAVGTSALSTHYLLHGGFHTPPDSYFDMLKDFLDNCMLASNADQRDTDGDGYGNRCDADLDNSGGVVNFGDLALFKTAFGTSNPDADFDGNGGVVNFGDLATFKTLFGKAPGPSCCGTLSP